MELIIFGSMENYNVLLIGSGAREHAIAWKISESQKLGKLFISPGNPGTLEVGKNVQLNHENYEEIATFISENNVNMLIIGPEAPLVDGMVDYMKAQPYLEDLHIIGPSQDGAQLEGSKDYAKKFMEEFDIPTASHQTFSKGQLPEAQEYIENSSTPIVLKADGLAGGKGVLIVKDKKQALSHLKEMFEGKFGEASKSVVIEEFLDGIEFSVFVVTDGESYKILPAAKDYKRAGEGDTGLNTGGMGSVSPVPFLDAELKKKVEDRIIRPTIDGLQHREIDYNGFIFFGLMNVNGDPYVIEYNVRLGDPEAQSVLTRVESDFLELLIQCCSGILKASSLTLSNDFAVTTVVASGGYPEAYDKGKVIKLPKLNEEEILFHSGSTLKNNQLLTSGGRVISATGKASGLPEAIKKSQNLAKEVAFENSFFRTDIGKDLL